MLAILAVTFPFFALVLCGYLAVRRHLLPQLAIPPLPCWLAVHREIHGNRLVRRVFDFLAEAVPAALEEAGA